MQILWKRTSFDNWLIPCLGLLTVAVALLHIAIRGRQSIKFWRLAVGVSIAACLSFALFFPWDDHMKWAYNCAQDYTCYNGYDELRGFKNRYSDFGAVLLIVMVPLCLIAYLAWGIFLFGDFLEHRRVKKSEA